MSSFIVEGNSEFDDEFANKDKPIKLELFPMLHTVITSRDPANLPFVNKLGENTYYFTTRDQKTAVTFELKFFAIIRFLTCDCL